MSEGHPMQDTTQGRRSTRLSISIPVVISGVDVEGIAFRESVRTLIVNKHGGKIATPRHLALNSELMVENLALNVVAKASVVWWSEKHFPGDVHHVGLQLIEAQNVWGIAFPPDDWSGAPPEERPETSDSKSDFPSGNSVDPEAAVSSLAGEEITIRLLQELQHSADDHAREFKEQVRQLSHRIGLELEYDLRERAAQAKAREVGALEEEVKTLRESLSASRQEIKELQAQIEELKGSMPSSAELRPAVAQLKEARQQLTAMTHSVVESMNTAAQAGLSEYRSLLEKENQASAERLRHTAEDGEAPKERSAQS
jgi:hypothetical protein